MTELNYRKGDIIARLNLKMNEGVIPPSPVVAEIVFRMGSFEPTAAPRVEKAVKRVLSADERAFIEKTVSQVKDAGLRDAIKRAMEEAREDAGRIKD